MWKKEEKAHHFFDKKVPFEYTDDYVDALILLSENEVRTILRNV